MDGDALKGGGDGACADGNELGGKDGACADGNKLGGGDGACADGNKLCGVRACADGDTLKGGGDGTCAGGNKLSSVGAPKYGNTFRGGRGGVGVDTLGVGGCGDGGIPPVDSEADDEADCESIDERRCAVF
jgi:hypothetical protein